MAIVYATTRRALGILAGRDGDGVQRCVMCRNEIETAKTVPAIVPAPRQTRVFSTNATKSLGAINSQKEKNLGRNTQMAERWAN